MARLILIRHGESVANLERRFTRNPEEPLSSRGVLQAMIAGERIRRCFRPVALYASPFARALETARLVGRPLGLTPEVMDALQEQDFGELRGQPYESLLRLRGAAVGEEPASVRESEQRTFWEEPGGAHSGDDSRWDRRAPGGESLRDVARRAGPVMDELAKRHPGRDVVVVAHGGVLAALKGYATRNFQSVPMPAANAQGYLLTYDAGSYRGPCEWPGEGGPDDGAPGRATPPAAGAR